MKILCDKCGNEFVIKENNIRKQSYTMRCPVCKNPINVKRAEAHDSIYGKGEKAGSTAIQHPAAVSVTTDILHEKTTENRAANRIAERNNLIAQQDMLKQIENGSDSIVEASESFIDDEGIESSMESRRKEDVRHWLIQLVDGMDVPFLARKYIPYIYYTMATVTVFTILFFFDDFIKLHGITRGVLSMFIQAFHDLKHYI